MVWRRDGWFPTKDRGWTDADGYFFHGGRADDVIISAGWTMSAVEIEDVLLKHPDVREAAVIGVPDPLRGLVVKAFIVSPRPGDDAFARELQEFDAHAAQPSTSTRAGSRSWPSCPRRPPARSTARCSASARPSAAVPTS